MRGICAPVREVDTWGLIHYIEVDAVRRTENE